MIANYLSNVFVLSFQCIIDQFTQFKPTNSHGCHLRTIFLKTLNFYKFRTLLVYHQGVN